MVVKLTNFVKMENALVHLHQQLYVEEKLAKLHRHALQSTVFQAYIILVQPSTQILFLHAIM